jgi:hypothetical protein
MYLLRSWEKDEALPRAPKKHSAKTLPIVTLDKGSSANSTSATASLPSTFYRALGKKNPLSRRLCRVSPNTLGKENISLPTVHQPTIGKGSTNGPFVSFFAECSRRHSTKYQGHNTRQRSFIGAHVFFLCRVLWPLHSVKWPVYIFFICFCYSIQTNKRYHTYITDIT